MKLQVQFTPPRIHSLDLIKGICIIFVIITHYDWNDQERAAYLFPFWIEMAVPIFMIISGFVYSKSFDANKIVSIENAYAFPNIYKKVMRFTIPFIIAFLIEEIAIVMSGTASITIFEIIFSFLKGGVGPGSYYYPIMIQFIFVFPVIYFIIKRHDFNGVIICGIINFVYELLKSAYSMNEECYRLLVFRYILVIAFGAYLAVGKQKINYKVCIMSIIIGIVYISTLLYCDYPPVIITYWQGTSFIACLYILPISTLLIKIPFKCKLLEILGRASYNIFLVQKIYYTGIDFMYNIIGNRIIQLFVNIIICTLVGVLFYYIETPITKFVLNKVDKSWKRSQIKCQYKKPNEEKHEG